MNTTIEKQIHGRNASELELIGDSYYDFETGEYVGDKLPDEFHVTDESSFEWVMEKIFNAEAELLAEAEKIKALLANYERKKNRAQAKIDWFKARFSPEVEQYAKSKLDGKAKFVECPFGRVSFRTKKGGLRVSDKDLALGLAKLSGWTDAIKVTEEFQISKLTEAQKEVLTAKPLPEGCGFVIEPDSETCTITTGVGK